MKKELRSSWILVLLVLLGILFIGQVAGLFFEMTDIFKSFGIPNR
jgi:hypothetical protein|tara:strand:- start:106 stop:240 length:135 start_codon:yes stop_codon:yes gene_type:complete